MGYVKYNLIGLDINITKSYVNVKKKIEILKELKHKDKRKDSKLLKQL